MQASSPCGTGNCSSTIDLRRLALNLFPATENRLKTSLHLLSSSLHFLWTLAIDLPAQCLQATCANQFQNIVFTNRVPQQLGMKVSPRKAAKTYTGCTAGFELQINSK